MHGVVVELREPSQSSHESRTLVQAVGGNPWLTLANELVHPARIAQPQVDIPMGVYPAPVARSPAAKTGQHLPCRVENADARRGIINAALTDIQDPLAIHGDVHGPL